MPLLPALCASLLLGAVVLPASAVPLAAEQWNKRVVVAFSDTQNDKLTQQIDALLADKQALAERDMLIIEVTGSEVSAPYGTMPEKVSAADLREAYNVPPETPFTVILVGKDGGEKLRKMAPVAVRDMFDLIDSMPMRQSESNTN